MNVKASKGGYICSFEVCKRVKVLESLSFFLNFFDFIYETDFTVYPVISG